MENNDLIYLFKITFNMSDEGDIIQKISFDKDKIEYFDQIFETNIKEKFTSEKMEKLVGEISDYLFY